MPDEIYLDHAASAPLSEQAREALVGASLEFGDPLSIHGRGQAARRLIDDARATIAEHLGAQADEIVFTSGGTESVALAIWGAVRSIRELGIRVVVSSVEHPSVGGITHTLESDGFETIIVPADEWGRVDLDAWAAEVRKPGTLLASLQHANHEIGTMQPLAQAARLAHEAGVLFHSDACQTVGRLPIDAAALGADLLSLSGHKFGGPAGVGALYIRRGVAVSAYPCGDDRERKRRSGMENLPGVAAMAVALQEAVEAIPDRAGLGWRLTERLRKGLASRVPGARVHGHPTQRVPHIVCFSIPGADTETLVMALDDRGFRIGAGSICSGAPGDPSPVLESIGVPATPGVRVSVGPETDDRAVDRFLIELAGLVAELGRVEETSSRVMGRFAPGEG